MIKAKHNFRVQQLIAGIAVALFIIKLIAWYLTNSVAILTDALESVVNVVASFIGLYSLYVSAKPRDSDHPYGHGKVEFISAAIEGTLIVVAGLFILFEAANNLKVPHEIMRLDSGIILVAITAIINLGAGILCERTGKKNNSLALVASGKHLKSDTYTTAGIIIGLVLLYITGIKWIDSIVAMIFAFIILLTGYKIIRTSIAGIMDEADLALLKELVDTLNKSRNENWVDLHNLRIIKYGATLHLDCHLTVPWYLNVHEAHREIDALSKIVRDNYGETVELFVHSDGCLPFSCSICDKSSCSERIQPFQKKIDWNINNISRNHKHTIES